MEDLFLASESALMVNWDPYYMSKGVGSRPFFLIPVKYLALAFL